MEVDKMRKKVYFSEIVFTDDYYINGINIFDENNIEFIDNIEFEDIDTRISNTFMLGFRKIKGINVTQFREKYQKEIRIKRCLHK